MPGPGFARPAANNSHRCTVVTLPIPLSVRTVVGSCILSFSPDSTRLIAVHNDGVHVWELRHIRSELAAIGQDWSLPVYPPAQGRSGTMRSPPEGGLPWLPLGPVDSPAPPLIAATL